MPRSAPAIATIAGIAGIPFLLGGVAGVLCVLASGNGPLGAWIGAIALVTLILPPLTRDARDRWTLFFIAAAVIDGLALPLLAGLFAGNIRAVQWLSCYLVLVAFGFALMTLARLIRPLPTIVLASLWLSWPIWLTPHINGGIAGWLTPAHPIFAINRVLLDHGVWMQQRLMYQYSTLGQDVPYTLPTTIWPCVILHLLVASPILWWWGRERSRESSPAQPDSTLGAAESSAHPD